MQKRKTITAKMVMQMIEDQGFRCALSGRPLTPETASLDHVMPLSRGGAHDLSNLWAVDHQVNSAKGTLSVEEFVLMCRDVASYQNALRSAEAS
jgi:5-methylcytosine-specific restriction endonuclease McrA